MAIRGPGTHTRCISMTGNATSIFFHGTDPKVENRRVLVSQLGVNLV